VGGKYDIFYRNNLFDRKINCKNVEISKLIFINLKCCEGYRLMRFAKKALDVPEVRSGV
jgi:hypothetical protein